MDGLFSNEVTAGWGPPMRFSRKSASEYVPTWQRGLEATSGQDFANLMQEGYSANSLIYSCIEEVATSFAELPPQVLLPDRDGGFEKVEGHELVALLDNPNETMDGYEFRATLATHHRGAGNVYIEKVRRSESADRNRSFGAIKELGLIRPDYVSIKPGQGRADDLFVVKVGGRTVKELPRADVIHVRTRNLTNDFYGLSPVALLIYEGNVDSEMTKFLWAFFRNAGVPLGILKTKTKPTPDEAREIKSAFRRMFNGVRKWFEVMILPADEATYEQLALPMKDMEMPETRMHVESRICAVFGVPPIIVGARVGLEKATYSNYEQAQFSFWSETMSPFGSGVASALTRELLPEYQTRTTRGARVAFDLSGVKALQEDNTARLKVAQGLVDSGGWTVNQALSSVGLPAIDGGDLYIRRINQITETPVLPRNGGRRALLVEPQGKAVGNRRLPRERLVDRAAPALEAFLAEQAGRVVSRLPKGRKAIEPMALVPPEEEARLLEALQGFWDEATQQGWEIGADDLGLPTDFDPVDPNVRRLLEGATDRIPEMLDETREQVRRGLTLAREQGLSPQQAAQLLRDLPAFGPARARTIARTEMAIADNKGATGRYRAAGVSKVHIFDGLDCGWTSHDDSDMANDSIRTVEDFDAYPVSHPNCVRSRAPVVESIEAGVAEARCKDCGKLLGKNVVAGDLWCERCKKEVTVG